MYHKKYFFLPVDNVIPTEKKENDFITVEPQNLYSPETGYGFVTEKNRNLQKLLQIPEINSGFKPVPWYQNTELTIVQKDSCGCYLENESLLKQPDEKIRQIPLCFKCDVPTPGNYQVTVTILAGESMHDIRIFTGRRRLSVQIPHLEKGEKICKELLVNVCDIIPRGYEQRFQDHTVDITVTADRPCISEINVEWIECPTLYICGDSTVTDQSAEYPYAPETSYAGWGQMMPSMLQGKITVSNHSHSGLTTESFRSEGHYEIIEQYAKSGDYIFLQFGHNDQKLNHLKAAEGYRNNLVRYIEECRQKETYPLLVTPVARNSWKGSDGSYNDLLKDYADVCLKLGEELHVPVLDLHALSMDFILTNGKENAKAYFYPSDFTHHNDFGAALMAAFVCQEIRRTCEAHDRPEYRKLSEYLKEKPDCFPKPRIISPIQRPEGYEQPSVSADIFENLSEPDAPLLRADALDMIIQNAGFFQVNVYNDLFEDVIGHEWYAGTVECALQNGIIIPQVCGERLFYPQEPVTLEHFIVFAINGYLSRRAAPAQSPCPYDESTDEWALPYIRMAYGFGILAGDGSDSLKQEISRRRGAEICKSLKIRS